MTLSEAETGSEDLAGSLGKIRTRRWLLAVAVGCGAVLCSGCHKTPPPPPPDPITPIADTLSDPRAFEGKSILVSGAVTDRQALLALRYFSLKDNTGEIKILTNRSLPAIGTQATVRGRVRQAFAIGDQQLVVLVEDDPAVAPPKTQ
jgi:hypothetical protein